MVVDTSAIIAILFDEPERESFRALISDAPRRPLLSAMTLLETSLHAPGTSFPRTSHAPTSTCGAPVSDGVRRSSICRSSLPFVQPSITRREPFSTCVTFPIGAFVPEGALSSWSSPSGGIERARSVRPSSGATCTRAAAWCRDHSASEIGVPGSARRGSERSTETTTQERGDAASRTRSCGSFDVR